jgi:MoaA/NifB/PqqE/SkfB family radical SAM enzyme
VNDDSRKYRNTFCNKLWDSAFIAESGDVFKCCHTAKEPPLGNIYKNSLKTIWNAGPYVEARAKSLTGLLACRPGCTILGDTFIEPTRSETYADYSGLRSLHFQFGERCNIACIMCWQDHRKRQTLDDEIAISQVDLTPVRLIKLQGGEPLAIKSLRKYFDYVTSLGHRVSLITNGTLINEEWADKLAIHSDFVEISINAASKEIHEHVNHGSNWERVLRGIALIIDSRRRYSSQIKIYGHMTLVPANLHEIPAFIARGRSFGFDELRFGYDKSVPATLRNNARTRDQLKIEVGRSIAAHSAELYIDSSRLRLLGLVD